MQFRATFLIAAAAAVFGTAVLSQANAADEAAVRRAVDAAVEPLLKQYGIPGLSVGVTLDGKRFFIDYGVASKAEQTPVTRDTLFELGSISKTFTAALVAYAAGEGKLSLNDKISQHMPELKGSALDNVRLVELGTHTAGGFPLQLPANVKTQKDLIAYFRAWQPKAAPGTQRAYANPSIGLLGVIAARAMGAPFESLMESGCLPILA